MFCRWGCPPFSVLEQVNAEGDKEAMAAFFAASPADPTSHVSARDLAEFAGYCG